MVQQLHRKIKKIFLLSILFGLTGCPFIPGTSPIPPVDRYMVIGESINCKFKASFKNFGVLVRDSLLNVYNPDTINVFLLSPYEGSATYSYDYHKSLRDQTDTGIKFYGFKKGDKIRAIVWETGSDSYDFFGSNISSRLGPFGDNDFTEEEFTTLLQRVDDYIDSHGGKWAKRAGENDTVLILGNYE